MNSLNLVLLLIAIAAVAFDGWYYVMTRVARTASDSMSGQTRYVRPTGAVERAG